MLTPLTAAEARANARAWRATWNESALGCAPSYKTREAEEQAAAWGAIAARLEAEEAAAQVAA